MKKSVIISVGIGLVLLMGMRRLTIQPGGENSHDAFYHVTMADFGPSFYTKKTFPSLTLSYWREHFSDKELTFHLILSAIRNVKSALTLSNAPPFDLESAVFAVILCFSFVLLLAHFRVDFIPLHVIAFVGLSPFLITRLTVLRPHLLAMSLTILACVAFDFVRHWRKLWIPALFGFVMAWSYSNPHFILLPAAVFALRAARKDLKLAIAIPAAAVFGIILGFTLHPQFPNTFVNWKIQCVDVVLTSLSGKAPVGLGHELSPGNLNFFISHWLLVAMTVSNAIFAAHSLWWIAKQCEDKPFREIFSDDEFLAGTLTLASITTVAAMALAVRAVEYAVPFTLLSIGLNIRVFASSPIAMFLQKQKKTAFPCAVLLVLLVCAANIAHYLKVAPCATIRPPTQFAKWLQTSGIPRFSVIGNANWSDFPTLFYAAPEYRYLAGIDPMFAYFAHPRRMRALERFRMGEKALTPKELFKTTGTRFIFVSKKNHKLAADMYKLGFVAIYQGPDGDLFDLPLSVKSH